MWQMLVRKAVDGPSSGTTVTGVDIRDVVDAREFRLGTDDLRKTRGAVELRVETRPGILQAISNINTNW